MLKKAFNDFVFLSEREGKAQTNFALTMPSGLTVNCAEHKAA